MPARRWRNTRRPPSSIRAGPFSRSFTAPDSWRRATGSRRISTRSGLRERSTCGRRFCSGGGAGPIGLYQRHENRGAALGAFFYLLIPVAVLAVAGVLFLGIFNFARGGSPERSNKLMQMRVLLQLVAIVIIMLALYFAS